MWNIDILGCSFLFCPERILLWHKRIHPTGGYGRLLQKKARGLLLPYLLWVLIAIVTCYPLVILNNHLKGIPLLERTVFAGRNIWMILDRAFGIGHNAPEPIGVLWFVRALMILFLCAPIWRFLARRSLAWLFVCLFVLLHFYYPIIDFHGFQLSIGVASFFFLGIVLAVYIPRNLLLCNKDDNPLLLPPRVRSICSLSFWIYVTHNIFMQYITAAGHTLFHKSPLSLELLCPCGFVIASFLSILSGIFLRRWFPKVFFILNGGRQA